MNNIKEYYKLCGVKSPSDKQITILDQIEKHAIEMIFTTKQIEMYIKDDRITIKETIIGGNKRMAILVI